VVRVAILALGCRPADRIEAMRPVAPVVGWC